MGSTFSTVIYDPTQKEIAKVNRQNKTLYLNPTIWKGLPADQKEFVLLHEEGHLELQTADEFAANQYAVGKFAPVRTLTNAQLAQRIVVMREILTPQSSFDPVSAIAGAADGIFSSLAGIVQTLPVLGIGSSARKSEMAAQADAQVEIIDAQSHADAKKSTTTIIVAVLAGVIIIVIMTLYLTLKK